MQRPDYASTIFKNDILETGPSETLGISFDEETTFSLSANTRITVDEFVYQQSGSANAALFTVARGTAGFSRQQGGEHWRHEDRDADRNHGDSRHHRGSRCAAGRDRRRAQDQAVPGCPMGMWVGSMCSTGRAPGLALSPRGRARLHCAARTWRPLRGSPVPDSAAGSVTRPRRAAAALCLAHNRSASDDPAPAITRAQPATAERVAATGRPARAAKHSREPRRATDSRAGHARPAAGGAAQAQSVRAKTEVAAALAARVPLHAHRRRAGCGLRRRSKSG